MICFFLQGVIDRSEGVLILYFLSSYLNRKLGLIIIKI